MYKEATGKDLLIRGGTGNSIEEAVYIIPSPDYVDTEYKFVDFACYLNGAKRTETKQELAKQNGGTYDVLTMNVLVHSDDGKDSNQTWTMYFDVTDAIREIGKYRT